MKEHPKKPIAAVTDGILLAAGVAFTVWVALTQSAALAAPTTALFTAALLATRGETAEKSFIEHLRRPVVGIGTTLTAFLWLLSTTQPRTDIMPTNAVEALIIFVGLSMATSVIIVIPIVFAISRLRATKEDTNLLNRKTQEYALGIVCSVVTFLLVFFMLKLSEGIVGPAENEAFTIVFAIVAAPIFGWFLVFTERNRKSR